VLLDLLFGRYFQWILQQNLSQLQVLYDYHEPIGYRL
jgi:hypothetical protein